jgi:predicted ATPase
LPTLLLHPADTLLADLLLASQRMQIMVATQSVTLVNGLTPEHVWTVNLENEQSVFTKLSLGDDSPWLEDFILGELWEKNIIEARP